MTFFTYDYLERNGRLGNQLWQIAGTVSTARKNRGYARFNPKWTYRPYFNVPDELFRPIPVGEDVMDMGTNYCQHLDYLVGVTYDVKEWFKASNYSWDLIHPYLIEKAPNFWGNPDRTAVHVRRGDYLKNPGHFPLPTVDYYVNNVQRWPDASVFVFSDDIPWCRRNFPSEWNFVEGIETPVEVKDRPSVPDDQFDLFAMMECSHHVISNSTFSWWGAFLSNNTDVVYPKPWFGPRIAQAGDNHLCPAPKTWIEEAY